MKTMAVTAASAIAVVVLLDIPTSSCFHFRAGRALASPRLRMSPREVSSSSVSMRASDRPVFPRLPSISSWGFARSVVSPGREVAVNEQTGSVPLGLVGAAIFGMLVTAAAGSVVAQAPAEYGPIFVFNCCALATASLRGAGTQGLFSGDAESESIAHNMEGEEGDGGKCMTELGVVEFCVSDASSNEAGGAHERGEDEKDGDEMSVEDEVFLAKWADKEEELREKDKQDWQVATERQLLENVFREQEASVENLLWGGREKEDDIKFLEKCFKTQSVAPPHDP